MTTPRTSAKEASQQVLPAGKLETPAPSPAVSMTATTGSSESFMFGTVASTSNHASSDYAAGIRLVTLGLAWDQFEPAPGEFDATYIAKMRSEIAGFKNAGLRIVLDPGVQYTPSWVLQVPDGRYVNQYGQPYVDTASGKNIANLVFNQKQRDDYANYLARAMNDLGANTFYGVRLGGGWYNELQYPGQNWGGHTNCYWAFDDLAQGRATGLAQGVSADPVPDWKPDNGAVDHAAASTFINWYLASMANFQNWQIATMRQYYPGYLFMLYSSWGVRDGQIAEAVADNLGGKSSTEINGEIQRGTDYAQFIADVKDPGVVVYTTWLDASDGSDASTDSREWRPVHWLAQLAAQNPNHLKVFGENTGHGSYTDMDFTLTQAKAYGLMGMMWAFEPELYGSGFASLKDYQTLILGH